MTNYYWVDNPTKANVAVYDPDILNECLMNLKYNSSLSKTRHTVLQASVDASGIANYLTSSSLMVTLNASSLSPFIATISKGFDGAGAVDKIIKLVANLELEMTPSSTEYIYIDAENPSPTLAKTSIAPVYSIVSPSHYEGAHWFDINNYKMYESIDSQWVEKEHLFIAETISDEASVTDLYIYALNGYYCQKVVLPSSAAISYSHRLGVPAECYDFKFFLKCIDDNYGWSVGDTIIPTLSAGGLLIRQETTLRSTTVSSQIFKFISTSGSQMTPSAGKWDAYLIVKRSF